MTGNNGLVSESKENIRLSQPTRSLILGGIFFTESTGNKRPVNLSIMNVLVCKRIGIRISFQYERLQIQFIL